MINIDFLTLKAFWIENIDFFIGARLQKIQQPTRREFVLSLRNNSEGKKLYININPQIYHLAFMSKENEERRNVVVPKHPPMFCMLLRKYLEGCRVVDAVVVENERIFELHFETYDELSERRYLCLCVELMGKHSNVILYDREDYTIIGCAHNVGAEKSRYRELQGGLKYIYPPRQTVGLSNELNKQFEGLDSSKIDSYLSATTFRPAIAGDRYTLFAELLDGAVTQLSVNEMLDSYYSKYQEEMNLRIEKDKFYSIVFAKLKKVNSSIDKISVLLKKRDNTEKYKLYGELLTANIYQKKDFASEIEVFDYVHNENIKIELDSTKTLNENAQRYFKLYTKSKTTKEKTSNILEGLKVEKEYLETLKYSVDSALSIKELEEIKSELGLELSKSSQKDTPSIMKLDVMGYDVYVGKNNKQNDYIISKLSKDEDYWFHTRLCAGSHVLLKVREKEPSEAVIYECCVLARKYSSAAQPSKVGVIYTKRKFIKKPPGAPLGYVIYKNEKEILV